MSPAWVVALALAVPARGDLSLAPAFPPGVPEVAGWERIEGEADLADPDLSVRYEFYVRPGRLASYEVVRYHFAGPAAQQYGLYERLQWDVDGRVLHRYECRVPEKPPEGRATRAGEGACEWRELARETQAFQSGTGVLLWLYGLHRRLLAERDAGTL